ncbi:MAG: hypothetical protein RLZZ306_1766 [Bacteroidota bacterium]|jgi:hypothetical protein
MVDYEDIDGTQITQMLRNADLRGFFNSFHLHNLTCDNLFFENLRKSALLKASASSAFQLLSSRDSVFHGVFH